jgi:hypothetical protein
VSEWDLETREVTTAELDELVISLKAARNEYDIAKTISSDRGVVVDELENKLVELLVAANKKSYEVDGVARVTVVNRTSVTTPKTPEEKEALFAFLEKKFGREGLIAYQSVNSMTLNSLYNKEYEEAIEKGLEFEMGAVLAMPTITRKLQVRSK